jgi:hypothetical protein
MKSEAKGEMTQLAAFLTGPQNILFYVHPFPANVREGVVFQITQSTDLNLNVHCS